MNEVTVSYNEKDLLVYFQKVRLLRAKDANDKNVDRTAEVKEEKTTLKGAFANLGKKLERSFNNYEGSTDSINKSLEEFDKKHEKVMSKEEAEELANRLFENDKYGLAKLMFAVTVILDDEYKYEYVDEGLKGASEFLYGDEGTLPEIKHQLDDNFKAISSKSFLSSVDDKTVGISAAGFVASLILVPIVALAGAAVVGAVAYDAIKKNEKKIKEEFKKSSSDVDALYLAIQCTYIQRIKKTLSEDEFKEELDSILKHINELKSDLDYYLFVEKESVKENRMKSKSFHEFDNRLIKILGIEDKE